VAEVDDLEATCLVPADHKDLAAGMVNAELRKVGTPWSAAAGIIKFDRHRATHKLADKLSFAFNLDEANDRCIARELVRNPADRLRSFQPRFAIGAVHYLSRRRCGKVRPSPQQAFRLNRYSMMPVRAKPKRRGRPATGRDPMMGFRAAPLLRASIVKWAENQADLPTLSEATRRLIELGLTVEPKSAPPDPLHAARASELAAKTIDKIGDPTADPEEHAQRRGRLTKGPEEFREVRVDRPKSKK
jgi:hypothetical protein